MLFSISVFDYKIDNEIIIVFAIGIALLSLILFILNKKKVYEVTYKIIPSALLSYNIVGFIIGVSITLLLAYTRS